MWAIFKRLVIFVCGEGRVFEIVWCGWKKYLTWKLSIHSFADKTALSYSRALHQLEHIRAGMQLMLLSLHEMWTEAYIKQNMNLVIEIAHPNSMNFLWKSTPNFFQISSITTDIRNFGFCISKYSSKMFQNYNQNKWRGWSTVFSNFYETKTSGCHFNYMFTIFNLKATISQFPRFKICLYCHNVMITS